MVRVHIFVTGLVQGVFFRQNTMEQANKYNLKGWVRNLPDGVRVETIAEGSKENLDSFIEWCHHGPSHARVDDVKIEWEEPTGEFTDFSVTY